MLFDMQNDYFQKKEKTTFRQNIGASTKLLLACCCIPVTLFNFDICSMTIFRKKKLFWPFDPTQESRMRVRAKFLLVWCRVFHSL